MLSPRRALISKADQSNKKLATPETRRGKIGQIFKNRKFYLDIKGKYPSSLVNDIENLGGVSLVFTKSITSYSLLDSLINKSTNVCILAYIGNIISIK